MQIWSLCLKKCTLVINNPKKLLTSKMNKNTASGYSLFTNSPFHATRNKLDCDRRKDCMKNFCLDLKEHTAKIINYEKQKIMPLTNKEKKLYRKQEICYVYKRGFITDDDNKKERGEEALMIFEI